MMDLMAIRVHTAGDQNEAVAQIFASALISFSRK